MNTFIIIFGFIAVIVGGAVLAGFPGCLLALGFGCILVGFLDSIEISLHRLAKRWAPQ